MAASTAAELQDDRPAPKLVVHGIFCKGERPRASEVPEDYSLANLAQDQIMVRKRLHGKQQFVKEDGLVTPDDENSPKLWHNDIESHDDEDSDDEDEDDPFDYPLQREDRIYEERSVLMQSFENYQHLINHPTFSNYMPTDAKQVLKNDDVRFGENLVVSGLEQTQICIGDVFEAQGGGGGLRLQVTSPRLPCSYVDKRNGSPFGMKGLKRYTMTKGLAGWFVRVLQEGPLEDGMELVRVEHPHPKWNLEYVSKTLYSEGDKLWVMMSWAQWARSKEELAELCSLPAFGWYEWKAEAQWLLDRWGREDVMTKEWIKNNPQSVWVQHSNSAAAKLLSKMVSKMPTQQLESMVQSLQMIPGHAQKAYGEFVALMIVGLAWFGFRAMGWP